jgi:polysaccharide biosynthesis protein PelE
MNAARLLVLGTPLAIDAGASVLIIAGHGLAGLAVHALAAALAGLAARHFITPVPASHAASVTAALLALALPLAGPAILAFVALPSWSRERNAALSGVVEVALPDGSLELADETQLDLAAARPIRQQLSHADSADARVRAVMALRHMDARRAVPLLRLAFGHASEDVRLLAFGILEQREKRLRTRIEQTESRLAGAFGLAQRARLYRRLARDHWELVYSGFVSGDLEPVVLDKARDHAHRALAARPDANTALLLARIHLRQHEPRAARRWLTRACEAGAAPASAAPWFAEAAYLERRFSDIPNILRGVRRHELRRPGVDPVAEFWTERAPEA